MQLRRFLLILAAVVAKAETVPLVVNFQLTDLEYKPRFYRRKTIW